MSIPFTNLTGKDADQAGYFRIGHVVLKNPPTDILTNRVSGKERITVLCGSNDLVKFSGKARWDVTVRWISMADTTNDNNYNPNYDQWEDLRSIVSIFKAAPFVEVENSYIREVICERDPALSPNMRMAFGLRQLRISTHPDIIDAFDCSLTMTWFNYAPYSDDFGYLGDQGQSVDANQSIGTTGFTNYISTWTKQNIDNPKDSSNDVQTSDWKSQETGTVRFSWREYAAIKYNTLVVTGDGSTSANTAEQISPNSKSDIVPTGTYDSLIQKYAKVEGLSPAMVKAVMMYESSGKPNAVQGNLRFIKGSKTTYKSTTAGNNPKSVSAYLLQHIQNDPDGGAAVVATYISQNGTGPDLGLMQLHYPGTATKYLPGARPVDCLNPENSIKAGCSYLKKLYSTGMTDSQIYAYNTGSKNNPNSIPPTYAYDVNKLKAKYEVLSTNAIQPNLQPTSSTSNQIKPTSLATGVQETFSGVTPGVQESINNLLVNGWKWDHNTNDLIYFYFTHELVLTDKERGEDSYCDLFPQMKNNPATIDMFTKNISVLMVNNLAQIPLANQMYPTYQHVGSTSSAVSLGFTSVGLKDWEEEEPSHVGISLLGSIQSFLDNQYLTYRNNTRNVDSIHRMQAVCIENKFLNMIGIRSLTLDNISTETIPETANEVQVELTGAQYENIFESTPPFKINTIEFAAAQVTKNIVNSGQLANLPVTEQNSVPSLYKFAQGRWTSDLGILSSYLLQIGKQNSNLFGVFSNTEVLHPTPTESDAMLELVTPVISKAQFKSSPISAAGKLVASGIAARFSDSNIGTISIVTNNMNQYPAIVTRMQTVAQTHVWTAGDVMLIYALSSNGPSNIDTKAAYTIADNLMHTKSNDPDNRTLAQTIYDDVFDLLTSTDTFFAVDINHLLTSSTFSSQYTAAVDPRGPALSQHNWDDGGHNAYKGIGLSSNPGTPKVGYSPAYYFTKSSDRRDEEFRNQIDSVINKENTANTTGPHSPALSNTPQNNSEMYLNFSVTELAGLNANTNSLVAMTNIPGLTMAEAFPTFKLFLMEDESPGVINCYDNFYSYASVTEMEIIRYRDQPDVAVIQITNIANLLMHHLFDNTLMGRYTYGLQNIRDAATPSTTGKPTTGGSDTSAVVNTRSFAGQISSVDLSDGWTTPGKRDPIPLCYIALQAGSKIQVRMGFDNNPDQLTPVFTGRVTKVDADGDMLVITAESFLGELCALPVIDGSPIGSRTLGKDIKCKEAGDTASVIEFLLTTDTAKHFGRFQLLANPDTMVTGHTWTQRIGQAIGTWSKSPTNVLTKIGAALASSCDRTPENILINHRIDSLGNATVASGVASYEDESSTPMWNDFEYTIKDNSSFTTWDLIKDVSRRHPEFNLICKQYGFPYSADATLVMAHPLDWYFSRPPLVGDLEFQDTPELETMWLDWWNHGSPTTGGKPTQTCVPGRMQWEQMLSQMASELGDNSKSDLKKNIGTPNSLYSFIDTLDTWIAVYNQVNGGAPPPNKSALFQASTWIEAKASFLEEMFFTFFTRPFGINYEKGRVTVVNDAIAEMTGMRTRWITHAKSMNPQLTTRLTPVRKYHFIDQNSIIHNGMKLNENIYNTVRVGKETLSINGAIPPNYRRVLDVTDLINCPDQNLGVSGSALPRLIAQSYLRDEVGKMYSGEIVLRGIPDIEPYDCLILLDPSTSIAGVVEVDKVIHSFTIETGYITIVYPRALVAINESTSANLIRMFSMVFANTLFSMSNYFNKDTTTQKVTDSAIAAVAGIDATLLAASNPMATVLLSSALMVGFVIVGYKLTGQNAGLVLPVTKFGRPWWGGLEGYTISDFWTNYMNNNFKEWTAENIYPLIDTWRAVNNETGQPLPIQNQPTTPALSAPQGTGGGSGPQPKPSPYHY